MGNLQLFDIHPRIRIFSVFLVKKNENLPVPDWHTMEGGTFHSPKREI